MEGLHLRPGPSPTVRHTVTWLDVIDKEIEALERGKTFASAEANAYADGRPDNPVADRSEVGSAHGDRQDPAWRRPVGRVAFLIDIFGYHGQPDPVDSQRTSRVL